MHVWYDMHLHWSLLWVSFHMHWSFLTCHIYVYVYLFNMYVCNICVNMYVYIYMRVRYDIHVHWSLFWSFFHVHWCFSTCHINICICSHMYVCNVCINMYINWYLCMIWYTHVLVSFVSLFSRALVFFWHVEACISNHCAFKFAMSHIPYEWVMSYMNGPCPIWISHVPYEWVMSHMNESCPICRSDGNNGIGA